MGKDQGWEGVGSGSSRVTRITAPSLRTPGSLVGERLVTTRNRRARELLPGHTRNWRSRLSRLPRATAPGHSVGSPPSWWVLATVSGSLVTDTLRNYRHVSRHPDSLGPGGSRSQWSTCTRTAVARGRPTPSSRRRRAAARTAPRARGGGVRRPSGATSPAGVCGGRGPRERPTVFASGRRASRVPRGRATSGLRRRTSTASVSRHTRRPCRRVGRTPVTPSPFGHPCRR